MDANTYFNDMKARDTIPERLAMADTRGERALGRRRALDAICLHCAQKPSACKQSRASVHHAANYLLVIVVVLIVVVIRRLERHAHRVLLRLHGRLALRMRALLLRVDRLVLVLLLGWCELGILTDLGVRLLVHVLEAVALNLLLDELSKLRLIPLRVLLLEQLHVLSHVSAENVLLVRLSIVLLAVTVVAREALLRVRDVDAAVDCALERAEDAVARRSAHEANIEHGSEGARAILVLDEEHLAVRLLLTLVFLVEAHFLQQPARRKQTRRIARSIVGEPNLDAVFRQLVRVRCAQRVVARDLRLDELANHVLVGDAHDEAVFGRVVLVLVLDGHASARLVVGLALTPPAVLDLVPLHVSTSLEDLDVTHGCREQELRQRA